jgi:hypothetical protein
VFAGEEAHMTAKSLGVVASVLLSMVHGSAICAQAEVQGSPAAVFRATGSYLDWAPLVEAESIVLALADSAGEVRTITFGPGELPVLSLVDTEGQPLPDGGYMWELRLARARSPELRRAMTAAERQGDYRQLARLARLNEPLVQSGYFTLENGLVITPTTSGGAEEESKAASAEWP